jgi:hypothetical protein
MKERENIDQLFEEMHEVEEYLHALFAKVDAKQLRPGDDLTRYAKESGLRTPAAFEGASMTWEEAVEPHGAAHARGADTIVLTRPGHSDAVGLVIKCSRVGKWKICLECGWIWCRIVISRRF